MHTSFGFLLLCAFSALAPQPFDLRIPGIVSIVLEGARLAVTILIHRRIARPSTTADLGLPRG